ncbi:MAG: sugar transferase [Anaerolineae bacterium]
MARFRVLLIVLLLWLTFLFNIERPQFFGMESIDLASFVYVLAAIIGGVLVFLPDVSRARSEWIIVAVLLTYGLIKATTLETDTKHATVYIIVAEALVLVVTAILSRLVSRSLANVEKVVENVVQLPESARVLNAVDGEEKINNELFRARRFDRPVTLLVIEVPEVKVLDQQLAPRFNLELYLRQRYLQNRVAHVIGSSVYRSDIVVNYQDMLVICLPETDAAQGREFATQIYQMIKMRVYIRAQIGLATFPSDALISQDLIEAALQNPIDFGDDGPRSTKEIRLQKRAAGEEIKEKKNRAITLNALWTWFVEVFPANDAFEKFDDLGLGEESEAWVFYANPESAAARSLYNGVKRWIDLSLAMLILPFALPVMGIVALLIYLYDRGPIFFVQERTGMGGKRFKMYKFRTMVVDAEKMLVKLADQGLAKLDSNGKLAEPLKLARDPRITPIGRILRKTSLDELPQLLNVLRGDMSIVGPRPTSWGLSSYTLLQTERLSVRPGITGLWQVCSRGTTDFNLWLKWDILYIDKMSFTLDFQIMLRTFTQVLTSRKGAR